MSVIVFIILNIKKKNTNSIPSINNEKNFKGIKKKILKKYKTKTHTQTQLE